MPNFSSIFSTATVDQFHSTYFKPLSAFAKVNNPGNASLPAGTTVGDLNGDWAHDFVSGQLVYSFTFNSYSLLGQVSGAGGWSDISSINNTDPGLVFTGKIFLSDFNGDGLTDIYAGTFGIERVIEGQGPGYPSRVYLQKPDGSFQLDASFNPPYTWDHGSIAGDIDGDGRNEIIVSGMIGYDTRIFDYQDGHWTYNAVDINESIQQITPAMRAAGYHQDYFDMNVVDMNNGHTPDVYVGFDFETRPGYTADNVPVYPHGLFISPAENNWSQFVALPLPKSWAANDLQTYSSAFEDLDGDGDMDAVVCSTNSLNYLIDGVWYPLWDLQNRGITPPADQPKDQGVARVLQILRNDNGTFVDVTPSGPAFASQTQRPFLEISIADINLDGKLDIIGQAASYMGAPDNLYDILLGDGNMNFSPVTYDAAISGPYSYSLGDYDQDGDFDFLTDTYLYNSSGQRSDVRLAVQDNVSVATTTNFFGTSAADIYTLPAAALSFHALGGDDRVRGDARNNLIYGDTGNDVIYGMAGDDTLNGGGGFDTLDGGAGVDTAFYIGASSAYTITQSGGVFTIKGPEGTDTLTAMEYARFSDKTVRLLPGSGASIAPGVAPESYMAAIRDFDGNNLTGQGTQRIDPNTGGLVGGPAWDGVSGWSLAGSADVSGSGATAQILFNNLIGRWAEVTTEADGKVYFGNHGWAGDTRIVGIYTDPEVALGHAVQGGPNDSQRRFQNDLFIGNLKAVQAAGDYNHDGFQEVYFSLTDGTAYLHAIMWNDGNIQYANYQSAQQVQDYFAANGVASSVWSSWLREEPMQVFASPGAMAPPLLATAGSTLAAISA